MLTKKLARNVALALQWYKDAECNAELYIEQTSCPLYSPLCIFCGVLRHSVTIVRLPQTVFIQRTSTMSVWGSWMDKVFAAAHTTLRYEGQDSRPGSLGKGMRPSRRHRMVSRRPVQLSSAAAAAAAAAARLRTCVARSWIAWPAMSVSPRPRI